MKNLLFAQSNPQTTSTGASLALLALRLIAGIGMILHGAGKISAPFSWMGPEAPVPGILQALAALAEAGGGLALILGLLTPLASLGIILTMIGAVLFHVGKGDGFVQGYELALIYLGVSLVFLFIGPGKFSLDSVLTKKLNSKNQIDAKRFASIA